MRFRFRSIFTPAVLLGGMALACSSEAPTSPDPAAVPRLYFGTLTVSGAEDLGGRFQVSTVPPTAVGFSGALTFLADVVVPPLWAQEPMAVSGILLTTGGEVVTLAGTVSGAAVSVSGGGYAISATATEGGGLSGTGSAPGGHDASVTAPPIPTGTTPAPSNPTGTYTGTFSMETTIQHRNTSHSGQVIATCSAPIRISGTLTMHLSQRSDGLLDSHLESRWTEVALSSGTCPPAYTFFESEYSGIDFIGSTASLVAGKVLQIGSLTKAEAFYGSVSGNTVVGVVHRSYHTSVSITQGTHVEGWPDVATSVTLTRQ